MEENVTQTKDTSDVIKKTSQPAQTNTITFDPQAYKSTLETLRRRIVLIEKSKSEIKQTKEMFDDMFINDELYQKADTLVKEATKKRKDIQAHLLKQPGATEIVTRLKDLKAELKEHEAALTDELIEYYKTTGVTEIEDADGNVQEFAIKVRLKPKKKPA